MADTLEKGDPVSALDPDSQEWVRAKVRRAAAGGFFHIQFDTRRWRKLPASSVKSLAEVAAEAVEPAEATPAPPAAEGARKGVHFSGIPSDPPELRTAAPLRRTGSRNQLGKDGPSSSSSADPATAPVFGDEEATCNDLSAALTSLAQASDDSCSPEASALPRSTSLGVRLSTAAGGGEKLARIPDAASQILAVFRSSLGPRRVTQTLGELRHHVQLEGEPLCAEDIVALCAGAPDVFTAMWAPLSLDEEAIAAQGASKGEAWFAASVNRHVLRVSLVRPAASVTPEEEEKLRVALRKKPKKNQQNRAAVTPVPPPTSSLFKDEEEETALLLEIKQKKMDLLDAVHLKRITEEAVALREKAKALEERHASLKDDMAQAPLKKRRMAAYAESSKKKRDEVLAELSCAKETLRQHEAELRERGVDLAQEDKKKGDASASCGMLTEGISALLPDVQRAQQKDRLKALYAQMREWGMLSPAAHRTPRTQAEAVLTLHNTTAWTQASLEKEVQSWQLPESVEVHLGACSAGAASLMVHHTAQPSELRRRAWGAVLGAAGVKASLGKHGLELTESGFRGTLRTTGDAALDPAAVQAVAVAVSSALEGVVLAAVDVAGVPSEPRAAFLDIVVPTEQQLLHTACKEIKKHVTNPEGRLRRKHDCRIVQCQVHQTARLGYMKIEFPTDFRVNVDSFVADLVSSSRTALVAGGSSIQEQRAFTRMQLEELSKVCPEILRFEKDAICARLSLGTPAKDFAARLDTAYSS